MNFPTHGDVAPGFEKVRRVFDANFTDDVDVGASFCAILDGKVVADLWGGFTNRDMTQEWQADTLVNVYSTTKGLASMAFAWVVEQGALTYETQVHDIWPELKAARSGLTIGQLLSHQSGLCGVETPLSVADLYDWNKMCRLLENQEPLWEPGTASGYHAVVWGFLPGELIRRVTGQTMGQIFRDHIAEPLGADCYIGLPDEQMSRVAQMIGPNHARIRPDPAAFAGMQMPALYPIALQNPIIRPYQDASSPAWRRAEIAAANGQANARGIARLYGALARGGELDGVRILKADTIDQMNQLEWAEGVDLVLNRQMRRGRGMNLNSDNMHGPNPNAFGHSGAGGSTGFADPDIKLAIGYAMNQMDTNLDGDTRVARLTRAVYDALG